MNTLTHTIPARQSGISRLTPPWWNSTRYLRTVARIRFTIGIFAAGFSAAALVLAQGWSQVGLAPAADKTPIYALAGGLLTAAAINFAIAYWQVTVARSAAPPA